MVLPESKKILDFLGNSLKDKSAVIGVSGGIDSSLVLMMLREVVPEDRLKAIFMPDVSVGETDLKDILELEKVSGIRIQTIYIDNILKSYTSLLEIKDMKALGNVKSRVRMTILYYFANLNNALVVGTTNLTEYITGYFTKFGDGGCDLEPIIKLTKAQVRELAKEFNVPGSIIRKPPSAGLWKDQTDERELGYSYYVIDEEVQFFVKHGYFQHNEVGLRVKELYNESMHKRIMPNRPEMD